LKVIDPNAGYISDRPMVKVGTSMLKKYPFGIRIEDCAKVVLSEDLSPDDIMDKLHISDCAFVCCSKEQEEAVNMIAEDVASIRVSEEGTDTPDEGSIVGFFRKLRDTQMINAAEYKL
jgi:hypothetical protein